MMRFFLRSRIHGATVTETNLPGEESIAIDRFLLNAAGLLAFERVEIYNVTTGIRFETCVIEAGGGTGDICVNGAAAHLAAPGDQVIIACYCALHEGQVLDHKPRIVFVDKNNQIKVLKESPITPTLSV